MKPKRHKLSVAVFVRRIHKATATVSHTTFPCTEPLSAEDNGIDVLQFGPAGSVSVCSRGLRRRICRIDSINVSDEEVFLVAVIAVKIDKAGLSKDVK